MSAGEDHELTGEKLHLGVILSIDLLLFLFNIIGRLLYRIPTARSPF